VDLVVRPRTRGDVRPAPAKPVGEELAEGEPADVETMVANLGHGPLAAARGRALTYEAALARGPTARVVVAVAPANTRARLLRVDVRGRAAACRSHRRGPSSNASASASDLKRRECWRRSWRQRTTQAPRSGWTLTGRSRRVAVPTPVPMLSATCSHVPNDEDGTSVRNAKSPALAGLSQCAQGDSNSHPAYAGQGPQPCASTNSATGAWSAEYRAAQSASRGVRRAVS
jgi:hypothetical protein